MKRRESIVTSAALFAMPNLVVEALSKKNVLSAEEAISQLEPLRPEPVETVKQYLNEKALSIVNGEKFAEVGQIDADGGIAYLQLTVEHKEKNIIPESEIRKFAKIINKAADKELISRGMLTPICKLPLAGGYDKDGNMTQIQLGALPPKTNPIVYYKSILFVFPYSVYWKDRDYMNAQLGLKRGKGFYNEGEIGESNIEI